MQVIDAHIHIAERNWRFGADLTFGWDDLGQAFSDEELIRAQIMPIVGITDDSLAINQEFFYTLNQKPYKDRVWAFYWPNPNEVDFDFASRSDVSGIKCHPSIHRIKVDQMTDVLKVTHDTGLPLLVHCGRDKTSHIDYLLNAYRENPDILFIAAHLGGLANDLILMALDKIEALSDRENLYFDTSGCMNPKIMRRAIDVIGEDHVFFGTDRPFFDLAVSQFVLHQTGLKKSAIQKVLSENILRIHK